MAGGMLTVLGGIREPLDCAWDALEARWRVVLCPSVVDLGRLLQSGSPEVGLLRPEPGQVSLCELESLLAAHPHTLWIALVDPADFADPDVARIVANSCVDYLTLPIEGERLAFAVGHAMGMAQLRRRLTDQLALPVASGLLGSSRAMRQLSQQLLRVAAVDAPVLVCGETGTGKELVARALHDQSARRQGPFIAVNCGALPATLIHSELFGHGRGAVTGAAVKRIGRIEASAGGTVLLDEIGDLSADLQAHLLRFLQESTIERLATGAPIRVATRVTAAPHVDLEAAVAEGRFREDLYYRLNVLRLQTPPLRERSEDIELLARFFFERFRAERAPGVRGFSRETLDAMQRHAWPGNVRELINRVRRAMVMCENGMIRPQDVGLERRLRPRYPSTLDEARLRAEKEAIVGSLRAARNNVTRAAEQLGIARVTLYRLMLRHGLRAGAAAISAN